ncbi:MAG: DNA repair protein RecN [Oscillospiraceae bacterium]|nr:DNA repair protein RecN [Oscillospiraceae bacterium]
MLFLLHIENIAIIERADIEFDAGFNALTGETGAGKSIVIDAIGAVLGQRASRELIRTGADKAVVSAVFNGIEKLAGELEEIGVSPDEDGNLALQRNIGADGKTVCRVNGMPVTVAQLRAVGERLLDIHGQHEGQRLLDESTHLSYLDGFGKTETVFASYAAAFDAMRETSAKMNALRMDEEERERNIDSLTRQIKELTDAGLREGEEEELEARRNVLRNSEKFISAVGGTDYNLNGSDDALGAVSMLTEAESCLSALGGMGEEFDELLKRLRDVRLEAYDIAETVRDIKDGYNFSPEELDAAEGRLDRLQRLKKKYGTTVSDMLAYLERSEKELDEIQCADDAISELEGKLAAQRTDVSAAARKLTDARLAAAKKLEERILSELRGLDMKSVRFSIAFEEKAPDATGADSVRFLMSANAGEGLKPINKIASGGEMARIMLALKNVLAENDSVGTLVFDEVDAGVSGRAAEKVAEKMAQVSRRKQVLCVTHLPQLAAMADVHFSVEKAEKDGRTYTKVTRLGREERRSEIARLTSGSHVTQTMLDGAEELLESADRFKSALR